MKRIGGDVRRELDRFGPASGMADLVTAWPEAVGPEIARNAWPARLGRDRTLHVATSSSAWAFELGHLSETILERLREHLGDGAPATLRFAVGKLPEPVAASSDATRPRPRAPGPEETARAADLAAGIADEKLRKTVAEAVARGLARGSTDRPV